MTPGLFGTNFTVIESAEIYTNSTELSNERYDILSKILSFEFTESLFSHTIYGSVILTDDDNFLNKNLLRTHGEILCEIKIKNIEDEIFEYIFVIGNVELEIKNEIADGAVVVLSLISRDFFRNLYRFKSKGYVNLPITDIIKQILKEELNTDIEMKEENFQNSEDKSTYGFTKIRPFEKVDILKQKAYSPNLSVTSTYLFYENRDGYNFKTFENIILNNIRVKPESYIYSQNMSQNKFTNPLFRGIKSFVPTSRNNNVTKITNGLFSSEIYRFDFNTKRISVEEFNLHDDNIKFKHIDNNDDDVNVKMTDNFREDIKENGKYTYFIPWNSENTTSDFTYKHYQYSKPFLYLINENTLDILIDGNLKLKLGNPINVSIWKNIMRTGNMNEDLLDKRYSGRYLIHTITNTIFKTDRKSPFFHESSVSLTKDWINYEYEDNSNISNEVPVSDRTTYNV
jgi:hypothetical protein